MSQNLRDFTKSVYALDGVVRRLKDSDWAKQSPNDDWTAKETLGHVIWGFRRVAAAITGDEAPAQEPEDSVAGEQPAQTWAEARDNLLDALDSHGALDKMIETPGGTQTVDEAIGFYLMDPLTHAWDIAQSAGIDAAIPEELSEKALNVLMAFGDAIRGPNTFDDAIDVDATADPTSKFIAYTGRKP